MRRGLTRRIAIVYIVGWAIFHSGLFWTVIFESIWRGHFWWPFTTQEQHIALGLAFFAVILAACASEE